MKIKSILLTVVLSVFALNIFNTNNIQAKPTSAKNFASNNLRYNSINVTTYQFKGNQMIAKNNVFLKQKPIVNDKMTLNRVKFVRINFFGLNKWIRATDLSKFDSIK